MEFLPRVKNGQLVIKTKKPKAYRSFKLIVRLAPTKKQKRRRQVSSKRALGKVPKKYAQYIISLHWEAVKRSYYRRHRKACAVCDITKTVDLHHMIYGQWGQEKDN